MLPNVSHSSSQDVDHIPVLAAEVAEVAAAKIHDRLTAVVVDAQAIPLQRPEVSGHSGEMILNGVYLVADVAAPAFHEQVEALRSEFEPHGIEIAPTGPWPRCGSGRWR